MTAAREHFSAMCRTSAALTEAKATHKASTAQLWRALAPILAKHKKVLGDAFEAAGHDEAYRERFGYYYGETLYSINVSQRYVELVVAEYRRGEMETHEFRIPVAYLDNDPDEQLARDLAHYQKLFERLDRRRDKRDEAETRAANLQELARLTEMYKNDPEAMQALGMEQPN